MKMRTGALSVKACFAGDRLSLEPKVVFVMVLDVSYGFIMHEEKNPGRLLRKKGFKKRNGSI